jgi:hypothetical protein
MAAGGMGDVDLALLAGESQRVPLLAWPRYLPFQAWPTISRGMS